jgi:hypothetical protein
MKSHAVLLFLVLALVLAPVFSNACRAADDDGGAGNATLGIIAVVAAVFLVVAWQMDFGKDESITKWSAPEDGGLVLYSPPSHDDFSAGLAFCRAF